MDYIGSTQIEVEQTVDGKLIGSIWLRDDIISRTFDARVMAAGGKEVVQVILDRVEKDDDHIYLSIKAEDKLIGIVSAHPYDDGYEIHPIILDEYRMKYATDAIGEAMGWVYKHKGCSVIYTQIPSLYKSMINFAKKRGFELVDIKMGAKHHNNGKTYDVWVLSLDKRKWRELNVRRS